MGKPTSRERERTRRQADRRLWKTLRDFVDEQAIEDVLETIENDRLGLDVSAVFLAMVRTLDAILLSILEYFKQDGRVSRDTVKDGILHPGLVT
jgi:predicted class III extradiol MEMO1 family dioxygenase